VGLLHNVGMNDKQKKLPQMLLFHNLLAAL